MGVRAAILEEIQQRQSEVTVEMREELRRQIRRTGGSDHFFFFSCARGLSRAGGGLR